MNRLRFGLTPLLLVLLWPLGGSAGDGPDVGTLRSAAGTLFVVTPGQAVQALKVGAKIPGDKLLVTPPGVSATIEHPAGVQLVATGNLMEFSTPPVQDAAFKLWPVNAVDVDLTLERGRVLVELAKGKKNATLRLRFQKTVWQIDLTAAGTVLAIERFNRLLPGVPYQAKNPPEPAVDMVLYLVKGEATLKAGGVEQPLKGQAVFKASNIAGVVGPIALKQLPPWLEGKVDDGFKPLHGAVMKLAQKLATNDPRAALKQELTSAEPGTRALALPFAAALDEVPALIAALSDAQSAKVRAAAVDQLRYWLGQQAGSAAIAKEKFIESKLKAGQADIALGLLHDFSDADLARPETYEILILYLKSDVLPIRELARWHLEKLVPAGRALAFDAAAAPEARMRAQAAWAKFIPPGQLPPKQ